MEEKSRNTGWKEVLGMDEMPDPISRFYALVLTGLAAVLLIVSVMALFTGDPYGVQKAQQSGEQRTEDSGATTNYSQIAEKIDQNGLVYDFANVISAEEEWELEEYLKSMGDSGVVEICVVTTAEQIEEPLSEQGTELFNAIGIGDERKDNGVLILVSPKTKYHYGQVNISTGYGMEGVLPDLKCRQIQQEVMIPRFKEDDYATGIRAAVDMIVEAARGEDVFAGVKVGGVRIDPLTCWILAIVYIVLSVLGFIEYRRRKGLFGFVVVMGFFVDVVYLTIWWTMEYLEYGDAQFGELETWETVLLVVFALTSFYHAFEIFNIIGDAQMWIAKKIGVSDATEMGSVKGNDYGTMLFLMTVMVALIVWAIVYVWGEYSSGEGISFGGFLFLTGFFLGVPTIMGLISDDFKLEGAAKLLLFPVMCVWLYYYLQNMVEPRKTKSFFAECGSGSSYGGGGHRSGGAHRSGGGYHRGRGRSGGGGSSSRW